MSHLTGQRVARRKVTRNSKSLTVLVPRPFTFTLKWRRGDLLELQLFAATSSVRIRAVRDVPREDIAHWPDLAEHVCQRKLVKFGNGLSIALPRFFWHALYAFPGDLLELRLSDDGPSLHVQPARLRRMRPEPSPDLLTQPVEER